MVEPSGPELVVDELLERLRRRVSGATQSRVPSPCAG
jgi:hypothetical protein